MRAFACALLVIASAQAYMVCTPGDATDDGVNACFCIGDGLGWVCAPVDRRAPSTFNDNHEETSTEETCEPGKFFKNDCNTCHCGPDGRMSSAVCTMMECDPSTGNKDGTAEVSLFRKSRGLHASQDTCEPGKKFKYYCNSCFCGLDGLVAHSVCTRMYCDPQLWNRDGTRRLPREIVERSPSDEVFDKVKSCEPGEKFMDYCNTCSCGANGEAACTKMYCDPRLWNKDGTLKTSVKVSEAPLSDELRNCEPGKTFKDYCNTCTCGSNGLAACTQMLCDPELWNKDGTMKISVKVSEAPLSDELRNCEPGKTFKDYCNTCTCGSNGLAACTQMYCDPELWNKDGTLKTAVKVSEAPLSDELRNCEPGKTFKDYCNTCTCGSNGLAACTQMYCDPELWNKDGTLKTAVKVSEAPLSDELRNCEPGKTFKDYCNTCTCGSNGLAACTQMYCDPELWNKDGTLKTSVKVSEAPLSDELRNCEPGKTFKDYCNTCTCGSNGLAACTQMLCDPELWNKDGTLKTSVKVSEAPLSDELRNCEPGKTFKDYCNTCTCGSNGLAACTQMYCDPELWNKDGTLKTSVKVIEAPLSDELRNCEPGKTFKDYCNTCTCGSNGLAACTQMYCDPELWNKDGTLKTSVKVSEAPLSDELRNCEPGKTFKDYCNTCTCGSNGLAACTQMYCDPELWNKDGTLKTSVKVSEAPLSDELRNCEPGKTFKDYCNTCTCGSNGLAACTQMYCDPELWNKDGTLKTSVKVSEAPLSDELRNCEPGKTFKDYCNTCTCGSNGLAACTQMYCDPRLWNKDGTLKTSVKVIEAPLSDELKNCEPGKIFNDYCNTCSCGTNGLAACTKMYCDPKIWNKDGSMKVPPEIANNPLLRQSREVQDPEDTCEPGKEFKHYCNTCFCGPEGKISQSACTRMACSDEIWNRDGSLKITHEIANNPLLRQSREVQDPEDTCEPGKEFKHYCNTCFCGPEGKISQSACTRMACSDEIWNRDGSLKITHEIANNPLLRQSREEQDPEDTCEPGKEFTHYCNTCFCGPEGKISQSACTRMACSHEIWNRDGSLKKPNEPVFDGLMRSERRSNFLCQPGRIYKDECNTCACSEDGKRSVCTMMACSSNNYDHTAAPKVCEPRKHFKIECNECMCSDDGTKIACTRMACHSVAKRSICEPNSTFKKDCNTCTCNSDGTGAVCTLLACNEPAKPKVCQPNSTFKKDCNTCTCNSDGTGAVCTLLACNEPAKMEVCQPNSTFKKDCNTCTCNSDGTGAVCTLVACNEPTESRVCRPNSTFKKDCNTCICNRDGSGAVCTLVACSKR